jgi:hypothetical protein
MKWLSVMVLIISSNYGSANDTTAVKKKLELSGYLKNLESFSFARDLKTGISGNFLHNRLNIQWKPFEQIRVHAGFRNRLFWGEEVKQIPEFAAQLRNKNEAINLQKSWIKEGSLILHTNVERLNLACRKNKWNLIVGRQRINWGITTNWNPNDIFNAYNYLDFDYEERSGVDAARIQYTMNNFSSAEIACALMGKSRETVSAIAYKLNKWAYDFQANAAWYKGHISAGAGWAGSIMDAGFKGEIQYYRRNKDSGSHLNLSLESDYVFKSGWYLSLGFLLNNRGLFQPLSSGFNVNFQLSPENLMPTRLNFMASTRKEITPLMSFGMSALYAPGTNLLILFPSLTYNLAGNLDVDIIWQSFFAEVNQDLTALNHRGFLRLKLSF